VPRFGPAAGLDDLGRFVGHPDVAKGNAYLDKLHKGRFRSRIASTKRNQLPNYYFVSNAIGSTDRTRKSQ
jgi:hypothetical protein